MVRGLRKGGTACWVVNDVRREDLDFNYVDANDSYVDAAMPATITPTIRPLIQILVGRPSRFHYGGTLLSLYYLLLLIHVKTEGRSGELEFRGASPLYIGVEGRAT